MPSSHSAALSTSLDASRVTTKSNRVQARGAQIRQLLEATSQVARRTGQTQVQPRVDALASECSSILDGYLASHPAEQKEFTRLADDLARKNMMRRAAEAALLVLALLTLGAARNIVAAALILVVTLVARSVAKKWMLSQARSLQAASWASTHAAMRDLGDAETYASPATGLYAQADALYVSTLPMDERMFEMQQRNAKKQQEQQAAHHAAVLSMHQQQLAAQEAVLAEQRLQTDAMMDLAYVRPSDRY